MTTTTMMIYKNNNDNNNNAKKNDDNRRMMFSSSLSSDEEIVQRELTALDNTFQPSKCCPTKQQIHWSNVDIQERLGTGGFSIVYKAYIRSKDDRKVKMNKPSSSSFCNRAPTPLQQQAQQNNRPSSFHSISSSSTSHSTDTTVCSSSSLQNATTTSTPSTFTTGATVTNNNTITSSSVRPTLSDSTLSTNYYAIKCVSTQHRKIMKSQTHFLQAIKDLTYEAEILANIQHENIIQLHGLCSGTLLQAYTYDDENDDIDDQTEKATVNDNDDDNDVMSRCRHSSRRRLQQYNKNVVGYFLILDLLQETLHDRLCRLHKVYEYEDPYIRIKPILSKVTTSVFGKRQKRRRKMITQKMDSDYDKLLNHSNNLKYRLQTIALPIARAMKYLHSKNILLRDLKPENVGFMTTTTTSDDTNFTTDDGIVKLFDFGLACNYSSSKKTTDNKNNDDPMNKTNDCNEIVGSYRYMAPEIQLGHGCSKKSDIYSFGIVLWELCYLQRPYTNGNNNDIFHTIDGFIQDVMYSGYRPTIHDYIIPSKELRILMRTCWSSDLKHRPSFTRIVMRLLEILKNDF